MRFKKGQSGNPTGRPKSPLFTTALRARLEKEPKVLEDIISKLLALAMKGDASALKLVVGYLDGGVISRNSQTDTQGKDVLNPRPLMTLDEFNQIPPPLLGGAASASVPKDDNPSDPTTPAPPTSQ